MPLPPPRVHHEIFILIPDCKAGVVAAGGLGIPGSEYIQFFHRFPFLIKNLDFLKQYQPFVQLEKLFI